VVGLFSLRISAFPFLGVRCVVRAEFPYFFVKKVRGSLLNFGPK